MRTAFSVFLLAASIFASRRERQAADKVVTLRGRSVCAKCELKETSKRTTAIQVTEKGER